jgi:hypothetical protein
MCGFDTSWMPETLRADVAELPAAPTSWLGNVQFSVVGPWYPFKKMPRKDSRGKSAPSDSGSDSDPEVFIVKRIVDSDDAMTTFLIHWEGYEHVTAKYVMVACFSSLVSWEFGDVPARVRLCWRWFAECIGADNALLWRMGAGLDRVTAKIGLEGVLVLVLRGRGFTSWGRRASACPPRLCAEKSV